MHIQKKMKKKEFQMTIWSKSKPRPSKTGYN